MRDGRMGVGQGKFRALLAREELLESGALSSVFIVSEVESAISSLSKTSISEK